MKKKFFIGMLALAGIVMLTNCGNKVPSEKVIECEGIEGYSNEFLDVVDSVKIINTVNDKEMNLACVVEFTRNGNDFNKNYLYEYPRSSRNAEDDRPWAEFKIVFMTKDGVEYRSWDGEREKDFLTINSLIKGTDGEKCKITFKPSFMSSKEKEDIIDFFNNVESCKIEEKFYYKDEYDKPSVYEKKANERNSNSSSKSDADWDDIDRAMDALQKTTDMVKELNDLYE